MRSRVISDGRVIPKPFSNPSLFETQASFKAKPPSSPSLLQTQASFNPKSPSNPILLQTQASPKPKPPPNPSLLQTQAFKSKLFSNFRLNSKYPFGGSNANFAGAGFRVPRGRRLVSGAVGDRRDEMPPAMACAWPAGPRSTSRCDD